jgi:hypothetical protein
MRNGARAATTLATPCDRLAAAQARLDAMMTGGNITEIETPQLGRVQFSSGDVKLSDLQRYVETLKQECAAYLGLGVVTSKRGPISVEVDP